jgi:monoterpene epsilon-lactone hydrolase
MRVSLANRSLMALLRLFRVKSWANAAALRVVVKLSRTTGAARPSRRLHGLCRIDSAKAHGDLVHRLTPREGNAPFQLLYLHGGAYSIDIGFVHWQLIESLIHKTGCAATVPLYPLAPENGWQQALGSVLTHYRELTAQMPASRIVIMGDSAGGGLALALAQAAQAAGLPQPGHIVLLSPWLDLTMSDPATLAHQAHDPVLKPEAALAAARMYAGDLPLEDPRISPIYGAVRGLAPVTVLTGTRDMLNPDARRFAARMLSEGQSIELVEHAGMVHAWMLLPMPEAHLAREQIIAILMRQFGQAGQ